MMAETDDNAGDEEGLAATKGTLLPAHVCVCAARASAERRCNYVKMQEEEETSRFLRY